MNSGSMGTTGNITGKSAVDAGVQGPTVGRTAFQKGCFLCGLGKTDTDPHFISNTKIQAMCMAME